jgi:hypothetical protein
VEDFVSNKKKLRLGIFWLLLGVASSFGARIDPQQIEDLLRIMNRPKVEVVLKKGDSPPPDYGTDFQATAPAARADAGNSRRVERMSWMARLRNWLGLGRNVSHN